MITRAVLCPSPPLLARELTGRDPAVPGLRAACAAAVAWLLEPKPQRVIVVGPAPATDHWDPGGRLDLSAFAPALGHGGKPGLPLSLGLGAMLLDTPATPEAASCRRCGRASRPASVPSSARPWRRPVEPAAMLVLGDGSARRSVAAPGHLDDRAEPFDDEVVRAVRDGDLPALAAIDPGLARELMVTGRPAWQVLCGALGPGRPVTQVLYAGAPFGVAYLVARVDPGPRQPAVGLAGPPAGGRPLAAHKARAGASSWPKVIAMSLPLA